MEAPILIDLPEELVSERTLLRPYRNGDGVAMFEAIDESREHILPWMPFGPGHVTSDDSETLIRTFAAKWQLREDMAMGMFTERQTGPLSRGHRSAPHRLERKVI